MSEFGVHCVRQDDGELIVIGRCHRGPLRRGTVSCVVRPASGGEQPVNLVVDRIVAYRREPDEIDEGLTAELRVSGVGGELIAPQSVLASV